jgi:lipid-A-disaccharide synthase
MQGAPMIVAYKTGWVTWALARGLLYKKTHITLLNILNDDTAIVPEFVQTKQEPEKIAAQAIRWIKEPGALERQKNLQAQALTRLLKEETPTAVLAAGAILDEFRTA